MTFICHSNPLSNSTKTEKACFETGLNQPGLFERFEKVQIALFLFNHWKVINIIVGAIQNDPLLLCILTSFQVLVAPESWSKYWNWCFIIFVFITKKFFLVISDVFCWFHPWNHWKRFKINKKGWKRLKKVVWPAFRCCKHLKAGQNTQPLADLRVLITSEENHFKSRAIVGQAQTWGIYT